MNNLKYIPRRFRPRQYFDKWLQEIDWGNGRKSYQIKYKQNLLESDSKKELYKEFKSEWYRKEK